MTSESSPMIKRKPLPAKTSRPPLMPINISNETQSSVDTRQSPVAGTSPMTTEKTDDNALIVNTEYNAVRPRPHPVSSVSLGYLPFVAIFIEVCVISFLTAVVFATIYLNKPGPLDHVVQVVYVTATTLLATIISGYTTANVKRLWIRHMRTAGPGDGRYDTLMGLGGFKDQFRFWFITLVTIMLGLNITAIVAGVSPTTTVASADIAYYMADADSGYGCVRAWPAGEVPNGTWFSWLLQNGSQLSVYPSLSGCPTFTVVNLVATIDTQDPEGYKTAYTDGETAVEPSAAGAAAQVYNRQLEFYNWNTSWLSHIQSTTACVLVFNSGPVKCRQDGIITAGEHNLTVEAGGCKITEPLFNANLTVGPASASGSCVRPDVGSHTIVIGALGSHARTLAAAMADIDWLEVWRPNTTAYDNYSVACDVDIRPALSLRTINDSDSQATVDSTLSRSVRTVDDAACVPVDWYTRQPLTNRSLIGDTLVAVAAAAPWRLLTQNAYNTGWWETLALATTVTPGWPALPPDRHDAPPLLRVQRLAQRARRRPGPQQRPGPVPPHRRQRRRRLLHAAGPVERLRGQGWARVAVGAGLRCAACLCPWCSALARWLEAPRAAAGSCRERASCRA